MFYVHQANCNNGNGLEMRTSLCKPKFGPDYSLLGDYYGTTCMHHVNPHGRNCFACQEDKQREWKELQHNLKKEYLSWVFPYRRMQHCNNNAVLNKNDKYELRNFR